MSLREGMMRARIERGEVERFEAGNIAADEIKRGGRKITIELKFAIVVLDDPGGILGTGGAEIWSVVVRRNGGGPIDVGAEKGVRGADAGESNGALADPGNLGRIDISDFERLVINVRELERTRCPDLDLVGGLINDDRGEKIRGHRRKLLGRGMCLEVRSLIGANRGRVTVKTSLGTPPPNPTAEDDQHQDQEGD